MAKPFNASVPQALSYEAKAKIIYLKGGVRGGKTRIALRRGIKECLEQPGIKVLVTRTTGPALYSTTLADFDAECPSELLDQNKCLQKPNPTRTFKNGSKVMFVAYDAADLSKIRGEEYGLIIAEEANLFPSNAHSEFVGRLSQEYGEAFDENGDKYTNRIERVHIIYVANSGGRNWLWIIFRRNHPNAYFPWKAIYGFTDGDGNYHPPTMKLEDWNGDDTYWAIEWGTVENKGNLRKDYWDTLTDLPDHLFKRLAEADDEPLDGMVFPNFDRRLHVVPLKGFVPPPHWPVYIGMDYGYRTPTVALWITVTEEGSFVAFQEYRMTMKSPAENARNILNINDTLVMKGMQDHKIAWIDLSSGFKKGESESGASVFDQLVAAGMKKLAKSSRDLDGRVVRIATLLEPSRLQIKHPITGVNRDAGWPRLMLTEDCKQTIQEIEEWEWSKVTTDAADPKEKPEMKDDHGIDALGYVLVKVEERAPEDYDSQRIRETSVSYQLEKEKQEWCESVMAERDESFKGRADGLVF